MSASRIIVYGFGSFGGAAYLPTLGFSSLEVVVEATNLIGYSFAQVAVEAFSSADQNITGYNFGRANLEGYRL